MDKQDSSSVASNESEGSTSTTARGPDRMDIDIAVKSASTSHEVINTGSKGLSMEIDAAETKFAALNPNLHAVAAPAGQHINAENMLKDLRNLVSELQESRKAVKRQYADLLVSMKTRGRTDDELRTLINDLIQKITDLATDMEDQKNTLEALKSPEMAPHMAEVEELEKICIDFIEESHVDIVILKVIV